MEVQDPLGQYSGSIFKLPNELLDEVSSYLSRSSQVYFMRTSHKMHAIGSRNLYRDVQVFGMMQSLRFFITMLSNNVPNAVPYSKLVHSFVYDSSCSEPEIVASVCSAIMADAFTTMTSLRSLTLAIPDGFAKDYIGAMHSNHICNYFSRVSSGHSPHPILSARSLGTLEHLQISRDVQLVDFLLGRSVRSLYIERLLTGEDMDVLIDIVARGASNGYYSLRSLEFSIFSIHAPEIFDNLMRLHGVFPALAELRIGGLDINALVSLSFFRRCVQNNFKKSIISMSQDGYLKMWTFFRGRRY